MEDDLTPPDVGTDAPVVPVVETPAPAVAAPAAPEKPASMVDAMFPKEQTAEQKAETLRGKGPRDPAGKFVPKTEAEKAALATPAAPVTKPAEVKPAEPAKPEDLLAKPEGLTPKAEARFQALANENRALSERADTAARQVEYVKTQFHENQVKPEQFEQATKVIGLVNRGDYDGAMRVLQGQMQQLALLTGKQPPSIDVLSDFPDLREAVDQLQITETMALELARGRAERLAGQQRQQQSQQTQQREQQEQQAVHVGTKAVDDFCKRMQASDMDYAAIEARLLPKVPQLLAGVPPQQWASKVQAYYELIKETAGQVRQTAPTGQTLRPTGQASPAQAPKTMAQAMWG